MGIVVSYVGCPKSTNILQNVSYMNYVHSFQNYSWEIFLSHMRVCQYYETLYHFVLSRELKYR